MNDLQKDITSRIKSIVKQKDPSAEVILFGSQARGDAGKYSDWDILILLRQTDVNRKTESEFRNELFDVELEIGQPISTFVFSKTDWESKHAITPLFHNIKREGIVL